MPESSLSLVLLLSSGVALCTTLLFFVFFPLAFGIDTPQYPICDRVKETGQVSGC